MTFVYIVQELNFSLYIKGKIKLQSYKAWAKLANVGWQTLLFVSESLTIDKEVTPDLRWKQ